MDRSYQIEGSEEKPGPASVSSVHHRRIRRKYWLKVAVPIGLLLFLFWWFALPDPLFKEPYSTVLLDRSGELLGGKLAADQQWRFPEGEAVPEKCLKAIIHFEDRWFFYHPGINPVAFLRALRLNYTNGKIVSGGSTITMQVIRLSRQNPPRTYMEKIREALLAIRLECTFSKSSILKFYTAHAPYGGNVVGLEAASWRYFGIPPDQLSWGQAATLAVLPNSPGLIFPGRNPDALKVKRDGLLGTLLRRKVIDSLTWQLAVEEPLPGTPYQIPREASHLLDRVIAEGLQGKILRTTIDRRIQLSVQQILDRQALQLQANGIFNAAALILEVETGSVLVYQGNLANDGSGSHGHAVDVIRARRSTGSLLKPILFAAMLQDGLLLPTTLVPDVPVRMGGFVPENFNRTYDGAVPAFRALSRSLNIPAVFMLQRFGVDPFLTLLRNVGMKGLNKPPGHYGLSLILGGAETSLWEMAGVYASMARTLNHFTGKPGYYNRADFHEPVYLSANQEDNSPNPKVSDDQSWLDAGSVYLTFQAMAEVARPDEESFWHLFASPRKVAWKTGTSFGNRDAWAIGVTPDYVAAVWVGNASGEGRPGLTGIGMAAPVLFQVMSILPPTDWFSPPPGGLDTLTVCRQSGFCNGSDCETIDTILAPLKGSETPSCPYHHLIHLNHNETRRVNSSCYPIDSMIHQSWFILPPVQAYYYQRRNPAYRTLPPWLPGCSETQENRPVAMIYPANDSRIFIPVELDGNLGAVVFRAAHQDPEAVLFWHLDNIYIGSTATSHQIELSPTPGWHTVTLVDQQGSGLVVRFEVIRRPL